MCVGTPAFVRRGLERRAPIRRRRSGALLVALLAALTASLPAEGALAAARSCGEIARIGEFGTAELVSVEARRVRCRVARAVLGDQRRAGRRGWECHSAGNEAECTRGRRFVSYGNARSVRRCGSIGSERDSDDVAGPIVVRRVGCRLARAVARGSRAYGPFRAPVYRARGFRCRAQKVGSALPTRLFTCRRGGKTVAFGRS